MSNKKQLIISIQKYSDQYYNQDGSDISDDEFDSLVDKLRKIDPNNSILNQVGSSFIGNKIAHKYPMLSLNKEKDFNALIKWIDKRVVIATPKYDGNSMELIYDKGRFIKAVTRGDGKKGQDITTAVNYITAIPKNIMEEKKIIIRGEAYLLNSVFDKIKDEYNFTTSPRNATAGMLSNEKDAARCKHISFVAYEILDKTAMDNKELKLDYLEFIGFEIPDYNIARSYEETQDIIEMYNLENRNLDYNIDGVVFMLNNQKEFDNLGANRHHPRGAIAFKYESEKGVTKLLDIECATGRTGKVSFTGIVEKILLAGANIERVTLHNADYIINNNINITDDIEITRSGEVIPKFERVIKKNRAGHYVFPSVCNSCGSKLIKQSVDLICLNDNCASKTLSKFKHYVKTTEILGVGESILEKLLDAGLVETIDDLYTLNVDDVAKLDRMGERSAINVLKAIDTTRFIKLEIFLASLGISSLGRGNSERLVNYFCCENPLAIPNTILRTITQMNQKDFEVIEGFANISGDKIMKGLKENNELIFQLLKHIKFEDFQTKINDSSISGESFVVTGTLSMGRKDIQEMIKAAGGKISSSVSKKTRYLVAGEKAGSKLNKAKNLGITIINEDELMKLIK